ncbi:hypothetical protein J2Y60_002569 [Arcicella sp. BE140]|nr:hypothetical protein [Arcicella sp. BE51]MDR6812370.1 hypothetical protein [Arcicella sp. BE140]MDR6823858.1 hypothetical protein [Arcicella sp. BE139]
MKREAKTKKNKYFLQIIVLYVYLFGFFIIFVTKRKTRG